MTLIKIRIVMEEFGVSFGELLCYGLDLFLKAPRKVCVDGSSQLYFHGMVRRNFTSPGRFIAAILPTEHLNRKSEKWRRWDGTESRKPTTEPLSAFLWLHRTGGSVGTPMRRFCGDTNETVLRGHQRDGSAGITLIRALGYCHVYCRFHYAQCLPLSAAWSFLYILLCKL
jgi:hypothetical protein